VRMLAVCWRLRYCRRKLCQQGMAGIAQAVVVWRAVLGAEVGSAYQAASRRGMLLINASAVPRRLLSPRGMRSGMFKGDGVSRQPQRVGVA